MSSFFDSLKLRLLGKKQTLMMQDAIQIFSREGKGIPQELKPALQRSQQSLRNHVIAGGALSLALSLSLQRYFPISFSTFSTNKLMIDLLLICAGVGSATYMGLKSIQEDTNKIKRHLLLSNQKRFIDHMNGMHDRFQLSYRDQIVDVLKKEELQSWQKARAAIEQI